MKTVNQMIDYVAIEESGGSFTAWNPNDNGKGVSVGLIQFNQKEGSLPELLQQMHKADPQAFEAIAGGFYRMLLDEKWVRRADLNDGAFRGPIVALLDHQPFQEVQRRFTEEEYLKPAWNIGKKRGLISERAVAMLFDAAVQRGVGWVRANALKSSYYRTEIGALTEFASTADKGLKDPRRFRILHDSSLSDDGWNPPPDIRYLRLGDRGSDVSELRTKLVALGQLDDPDTFGDEIERAVRAIQRGHGLHPDGVVGPKTRAAIQEELESL